MTELDVQDSSGLSRRTVVRGAAWTVPVVAAAATAPAYAASYCPAVTVNWSSYGGGNVFTSAIVGSVRVVLSVTGVTNAANNRTIASNATGGQSSSLRFYSGSANGSSQTATFQFFYQNTQTPVNVRNLAFSFLDIDSNDNTNGAWFDRIEVNTTGFTYKITNTAYVQGTGGGSNNSRFRPTSANTASASPGTSTNGNVSVNWTAPLNSVQFTYSQGVAANGLPFIGISNMSFEPEIC